MLKQLELNYQSRIQLVSERTTHWTQQGHFQTGRRDIRVGIARKLFSHQPAGLESGEGSEVVQLAQQVVDTQKLNQPDRSGVALTKQRSRYVNA